MASMQEMITELGFEIDDHAFEALHHKIEGISEAVKVLAGIEIIKGLYELAERFAGLGESLESAAITAGITTEALQKLQFAASQNAVSSGELSGALSRMGRLLYQAQKGSKGATEAFKKLGIDKSQIDSFASTEEALYAIQDGMGNLTTQQEKLAVVQQLFGRAGGKFLKFLQVGSDGTRKLGDSAEKMGAVISGEGVEALAEFEDAASGLGQVMKGFLATVASKFAPGFIYAIHSIEDAWSNNRQLISDILEDLGHKFAYFTTFASVVIDEMSKTINAILYRKGGIGDWVASTGRAVIDGMVKVTEFISKVITDLAKDGTLKGLFDTFKGLAKDLSEAVQALAKDLKDLLDQFGFIKDIKVDKLNAAEKSMRALASATKAFGEALREVAQAFTSLFKGEVGSATGAGPLGELYYRMTKGLGSVADSIPAGAAAAAASKEPLVQNLGKGAGVVGGYAADATNWFLETSKFMELGRRLGIAAPKADATGMTPGGPAPVYNIVSNVNVSAPPGMTPEQTADLYKQKSDESWQKILHETNRDTLPAWTQ